MNNKECLVMGRGSVTLLKRGKEQRYPHGQTFSITELGQFQNIEPQNGIAREIWERVLTARTEAAVALNINPLSIPK